MTVAQMRAALEQLPDEAILVVNQVGNVAVMTQEDDFIGYIDFTSKTYEGVNQ